MSPIWTGVFAIISLASVFVIVPILIKVLDLLAIIKLELELLNDFVYGEDDDPDDGEELPEDKPQLRLVG